MGKALGLAPPVQQVIQDAASLGTSAQEGAPASTLLKESIPATSPGEGLLPEIDMMA